MPEQTEIPLGPLADLQRRVRELEDVMVPLCEQTQELIREVLDLIHEVKQDH